MKKVVLVFCLLLGNAYEIWGKGDAISKDEEMLCLYTYASKNLNYNSLTEVEDIFKLCQRLEGKARKQQKYEELFLIQQVKVNAYCLNGDVGFAVNEAQKMYEETKNLKSDIGVALSIQAIGDTYMYSTQYSQAYDAFCEASNILEKTDYELVKVRLLIQQMHVCMSLDNMDELHRYLVEARKLLDRIDVPGKDNYVFYLQCYQTFHDIAIKDSELARISLDGVARMQHATHSSSRWYYSLSMRYYDLINNNEKALLYCDSAFLELGKEGNLLEYKNLTVVKAELLAKNDQKKEACVVYQRAKQLSDSLNMARYSRQIDSLRVSYWIDQMEIENVATRNRVLTWSVCYALLVLGIIFLLIYISRRKNTRLINSEIELEAIRKEAEASIQSKSMFLSNMSHELRTPLNAIVGFADLLSTQIVKDMESKRMLGERISQNAQLLLKLFNDVADLSKLKENTIAFSYSMYDAVSICRNVIDTVDNVKQTSASLHLTTSCESLIIHTDTGRLQQLLINLLINATKFTQKGTITLTLEVDEKRQEAVFAVEDTGCGIPLEKQAHIFERFEKLHEGVQGAGLGLSICQLIIEHIGGKIWIDSEYTNGTRFVFTHPLKHISKPSDNES